jgi:rhodanese-related sulfurtransferase
MTGSREAGLILLAALMLGGVTAAVHPKRPSFLGPPNDPNEITLAQTSSQGTKILWVDARSDAEFAAGHIPGAISLNFDNWPDAFPKFLDHYDPSQKVIVYCSASSCQLSREIAAKLRASGVADARFLKGGWEAWVNAANARQRTSTP